MSDQRLVVLTPEQLASLVRSAVADVMTDFAPGEQPALLTKAELARKLGCSPRTIDRLRAEGCPTIMLLDSPRFELTAVLGWLTAHGNSQCPNNSPTSQLRLVQPQSRKLSEAAIHRKDIK